MKTIFDRYTIYDFSDEAIILELCKKIRKLRRSCCISQTELAQNSGVSIASVKRIEAGTVTDLNICTLIKILRACGKLEGMAELIPDVPDSPFLIDQKTGKVRKNCRSSYKTAASLSILIHRTETIRWRRNSFRQRCRSRPSRLSS